jgi:hypothetical protein
MSQYRDQSLRIAREMVADFCSPASRSTGTDLYAMPSKFSAMLTCSSPGIANSHRARARSSETLLRLGKHSAQHLDVTDLIG